MAPTTGESRPITVSQNSYVSIGLMLALVGGAMLFGRQLQRLDVLEAAQQQTRQEVTTELRELRAEVRDLRGAVVRTQSLGR